MRREPHKRSRKASSSSFLAIVPLFFSLFFLSFSFLSFSKPTIIVTHPEKSEWRDASHTLEETADWKRN